MVGVFFHCIEFWWYKVLHYRSQVGNGIWGLVKQLKPLGWWVCLLSFDDIKFYSFFHRFGRRRRRRQQHWCLRGIFRPRGVLHSGKLQRLAETSRSLCCCWRISISSPEVSFGRSSRTPGLKVDRQAIDLVSMASAVPASDWLQPFCSK